MIHTKEMPSVGACLAVMRDEAKDSFRAWIDKYAQMDWHYVAHEACAEEVFELHVRLMESIRRDSKAYCKYAIYSIPAEFSRTGFEEVYKLKPSMFDIEFIGDEDE